jgi:hypothetical protein
LFQHGFIKADFRISIKDYSPPSPLLARFPLTLTLSLGEREQPFDEIFWFLGLNDAFSTG